MDIPDSQNGDFAGGIPLDRPLPAGFAVAIDGTAASGKGTLARRLGRALGCRVLDTGKLYRLVGHRALLAGIDDDDAAALAQLARSLSETIAPEDLADPALETDIAGQWASRTSLHPGVRAALLDLQRDFARRGPAILDGRDIGTVVLPGAAVKFFVTASLETRARRRFDELRRKGAQATYEAVLSDMRARDARDAARDAAPMKAARDAVRIDTSVLDAEAVFTLALSEIRKVLDKNP